MVNLQTASATPVPAGSAEQRTKLVNPVPPTMHVIPGAAKDLLLEKSAGASAPQNSPKEDHATKTQTALALRASAKFVLERTSS